MLRRKWLLIAAIALPLTVAGLAYGQGTGAAALPQASEGYICPLNGEELPCPDCCPLNQESEGYICPLNGEELPCRDCCPLNEK